MKHAITEEDLDMMERYALRDPASLAKDYLAKAILCIRELRHALVDPNYSYAGGRICRQAILVRNEQIDSLINEMIKLKEKK